MYSTYKNQSKKYTLIKVKVCANEVKLVKKFRLCIYSLICAYVQNVTYTYVCI